MRHPKPFIAMLLASAVLFSSVPRPHALAADKDEAKPKPRTGGYVYKRSPRRTMGVYYPDGWQATDKRPALVIFRCNIPAQREHFRKLGMVVIKPQTAPVNSGRLPGLSLDEIAKLPRPRHQVEDVKSAIRFIRANAAKLGVDPNRIVATGTSGGGDLALQGSINTAFEDAQDDKSVSHKPDALVLYCPAFDGIDIWFVKTQDLVARTKAQAPSFAPLLDRFVKNTKDPYATPRDHRVDLIKLAATLGKQHGIDAAEVKRFQDVLLMFNKRDWQLLHPYQDALKMSATRILGDQKLPPTLILYGDRDHLLKYQQAFVKHAREAGKRFELKVYKGGGHSFMMQPAFEKPSTADVESFLRRHKLLP